MVELDRNGCNVSVDNDVNSVDIMCKYVYDSYWIIWKIKWGEKNKIESFFSYLVFLLWFIFRNLV